MRYRNYLLLFFLHIILYNLKSTAANDIQQTADDFSFSFGKNVVLVVFTTPTALLRGIIASNVTIAATTSIEADPPMNATIVSALICVDFPFGSTTANILVVTYINI